MEAEAETHTLRRPSASGERCAFIGLGRALALGVPGGAQRPSTSPLGCATTHTLPSDRPTTTSIGAVDLEVRSRWCMRTDAASAVTRVVLLRGGSAIVEQPLYFTLDALCSVALHFHSSTC